MISCLWRFSCVIRKALTRGAGKAKNVKMYVISVDVGSNSVRVAITRFEPQAVGQVLTSQSKAISVLNPKADHFEQRSEEIWEAVCVCVKRCLETTTTRPASISGIAFTSTCSLVVIPNCGSLDNDVIMWMDHRAIREAEQLSETMDPILKQFGGVCSPEFSVAKLIWLKKNMPSVFSSAAGFLELPDWLCWRAVRDNDKSSLGDYKRSLCCLGCKWGFDTENERWPAVILDQLGLSGRSGVKPIGEKTVLPGKLIGHLSNKAALEMGLTERLDVTRSAESSIAVASSLIDAHSGVLAMLALHLNMQEDARVGEGVENTLCMIGGTSTCHMVLNRERVETEGVWGPYRSVILPEYYTREAGQSATGKLIEHLIMSHPDYETIYRGFPMKKIIKQLNKLLLEKRNNGEFNSLHVNPCFHGNRSPLADPKLRGGIYGLQLEKVKLEEIYEAALEALAYETKFIIEALRLPQLSVVLTSGGLAQNEMYMQIHSDVLNCKVISMKTNNADMMLVGSAILARQAALGSDLSIDSLKGLSFLELSLATFKPSSAHSKYHEAKYKCYREMVSSGQRIEKIMQNVFDR